LPHFALVAPVVDARRGQVYAALYGPTGDIREAPFVAAPDEAITRLQRAARGASFRLCGDGAPLLSGLAPLIAAADDQIDPKIVARFAATGPAPARPPSPLYLRPPDAQQSALSPFARLLRGTSE
ncbi:MAG TPA: hypothetical protein VNH64_01045, partial [Parvularculaceae bacterium]|nr:hypothetical protein [Parvularculaceae bacterium]